MKIHVGIVTYNNSSDLNKLLDSLFHSDLVEHNHSVQILNNHPTLFNLSDKFVDKVDVIHTKRDNHQTGHISKDYNRIIIDGFQSLNNPKNDFVVTIQDDNTVKLNFVEKLINLHETYNFITSGPGDNFVSYTPDAIKNIGLWDESLPSIGDADYLLRSVIWNYEKTSLNDIGQQRVLNASTEDSHREYWNPEFRSESSLINCGSLVNNESRQSNLSPLWIGVHPFTHAFINKWGEHIPQSVWTDTFMSEIKETLKPKIRQQIIYPDFECDIIDILNKY